MNFVDMKVVLILIITINAVFGHVFDEWLIKTDGSVDVVKKLHGLGVDLDKIDENTFRVSSSGGDVNIDLEELLNRQSFIQSCERQRAGENVLNKYSRRQCYLNKHIPKHLIQCKAVGERNTSALGDGDLSKIRRLQSIQDRNAHLLARNDVSISFNKFTLELFNQISAEKEGINMIISPYSVASALSMCFAGANGNTATQLRRLLNYYHLPSDQIHLQNQQLIQTMLNLNGKIALKVANKIFSNKLNSGAFRSSFLATLRDSYASEIEELDYDRASEAAKIINDWVMNKTENLIKELIGEAAISPQVKAILVNAIYFKGTWKHKFDPKLTSNESFYLTDGRVERVEMMRMFNKKLKLKVNPDGLEAVTCEFAYVGDQVAMTIILPNEGVTTGELQASLSNPAVLATIFDDDYPRRKVHAHVPKFKFEQSVELSEHLEAMGASDMFDERKADFSGMIEKVEKLFVSKVIHKAIVDVNELGTEAAAASAVVMVTRSAMMDYEEPYEFLCNKEFLFIIHEKQKNTIMFMGKYSRRAEHKK